MSYPPQMSRRLTTVTAALLLAGCAVGPDYVTPERATIQLAAPQAERFAATPVAAVLPPWWQALQDPTLDALVTQALAHNLTLRQAEASLRAARAMVDEREWDQLPELRTAAGYSRSVQPQADGAGGSQRGVSQSYRLGLHLSWEIDLFGRLARLTEAAEAQADAVAADLTLARQVMVAEVARAYFQARGAQRELALVQQQVAAWGETEQLVQAQLTLGSGLPEELAQTQAARWQNAALVPVLDTLRQRAEDQLSVLTGQRPGAVRLTDPPPAAVPLAARLPLGDVDTLVRQRPDVVRAERTLAAQVATVGAVQAERYPRLDLGGFLGFFALRGADLGSAARAVEVAPTLGWPGLQLGSVQARVRAAEAGADGALAGYDLALLRAQAEVEAAVTAVVQHQSQLALLVQSAAAADTALRLASTRYTAGEGSYQRVLEAQRTLHQARRAVSEVETASYLEVVALYQALGWPVWVSAVSSSPEQASSEQAAAGLGSVQQAEAAAHAYSTPRVPAATMAISARIPLREKSVNAA